MELTNTRMVPAPQDVVWAALNDPEVLKDCLPGCESIERDADDAWRVVIAARIGPVSARFTGRMTMSDIDPKANEPTATAARPLERGIGLCLSGGGFRAMLFHVGSLWRLNEAGALKPSGSTSPDG